MRDHDEATRRQTPQRDGEGQLRAFDQEARPGGPDPPAPNVPRLKRTTARSNPPTIAAAAEHGLPMRGARGDYDRRTTPMRSLLAVPVLAVAA
ncbi:MAG: hypothetical protein K8J09_23530, partial [Planctomycetes bacterium]|nr:hypothetical protein [Planctomycetota bacterium]